MKTIKSLLALTLIVAIPFGFMIWYRSHQSTGFASIELILYPLIFGGGSIIILYLLKKYFLKENISDFNSANGNLSTDIIWGLGLTIMYFILFYVERATLSNILSFRSNQELLNLMLDMRKNPVLLVLWFGPVLWIGIALYEELIRVFILTTLWQYSKSQFLIFFVIVISALIIGFAHWSQGSYGVVTIAIKSIVSGYFFFKVRRLLPLIIAHVLYDGIQVALLLITYPY